MSLINLYKSALGMVIFMLLLVSCNKSTPTENNNKIETAVHTNRIYHPQTPLISDSEFVIVQGLFQKNNLSLTNMQIYKLLTNHGWRYVKSYQFYCGLELFTNDVVFIFDTLGIYSTMSGELINNIPIDTIPKVTLNEAGTLFYDQIVSDTWYKDSLDSFRSRGFNAELGVYDLNAGMSYAQKHFVLAWKMAVASRGNYPVGYLRADTLNLIYYFNGIIIN